MTDSGDNGGVLRIIQSVPSKKAEPFKDGWQELVKRGFEYCQETKRDSSKGFIKKEKDKRVK